MAAAERCPTCGATARAVSGGEGTAYYEPVAAATSDVWAIRFPGLNAADTRTARLALLRLRAGMTATDPLCLSPAHVLQRDLPCSRRTAEWIMLRLRWWGWIDDEGRPTR